MPPKKKPAPRKRDTKPAPKAMVHRPELLLFLVGGKVRASGSYAELVGDRTMEEAFFEYCAVHIRHGGDAVP